MGVALKNHAVGGRKYTMDMCHGPLFRQIVLFTLPLLGSLYLQLTFNTADLIVLGRFASEGDLAAVGATTSLTNLLLNLCIGLSTGASVVAGQYFGAKEMEKLSRTTHTSMALSLVAGTLFGLIGIFICAPVLRMMKTPVEILPKSVLYMRICFAGMPFKMVYGYGSAILRATGDTMRPLVFLAIAGVVNVLMNLFFVLCCHMDVDGVGLATIISHAISAVLVWWALRCTHEIGGLHIRKLKFDWTILKRILWIGIPIGLQGISFNMANIVIQSSINSFGKLALSGNTAALSLEYYLSYCSAGVQSTAISFTAQNLGGRQYSRLKRSVIYCCLISVGAVMTMGSIAQIFGRELLSFFTRNPEVIDWGLVRMHIMFSTYGIGCILNVMTGTMRGIGRSMTAFIIVFSFACVFRIIWVFSIFPLHPTYPMLLWVFPISWLLIIISIVICLFFIFRSFPKDNHPWKGAQM